MIFVEGKIANAILKANNGFLAQHKSFIIDAIVLYGK